MRSAAMLAANSGWPAANAASCRKSSSAISSRSRSAARTCDDVMVGGVIESCRIRIVAILAGDLLAPFCVTQEWQPSKTMHQANAECPPSKAVTSNSNSAPFGSYYEHGSNQQPEAASGGGLIVCDRLAICGQPT